MATLSLSIPQIGQPCTTEDPKIQNNFTSIQNAINGGLDPVNLSANTAQAAGVNQSGQTVKGATNIATSETRTNTAYGTLPTPDQVSVVLPANGLIQVWFQATWQESVAGAARIAFFIGSNQLVVPTGSVASPQTQAAAVQGGATAGISRPVASCPFGLVTPEFSTAYTGDATTGQALGIVPGPSTDLYCDVGGTVQAVTATHAGALGGPVYLDNLAAGTYVISVQFKAASGSVTASSRRLRVQALSFS